MLVFTITIGKCVTEHRGGRPETCQLALGKCLALLGIKVVGMQCRVLGDLQKPRPAPLDALSLAVAEAICTDDKF